MDRILLNRIELMGSIGVLESEKQTLQRYWISVAIDADLREAGRTDRLEATIDYAAVFEMAKRLMVESDCELIECYAERLASQVLERFQMAERTTVEVLKPDAPIDGVFDSVGIQLTRTRDD